MAQATYTGDASQLFKVINQIKEKMTELQKLQTDLQFGAKFGKGALTGIRSSAKAGAEQISRNLYIEFKARITGIAEAKAKMRAAFTSSVMVKLQPYITNAALAAIKQRLKTSIGGGATVEVGMKFQTGAAGKFRDTVKAMLRVISRASFVEAELRLKGAAKVLDGLKGKKVLIDVDVKAGTAAKIKALLALLKELRKGTKIPVKLDIAPGLMAVLKALGKELKNAADQAARLNQRMAGAAGSINRVASSTGTLNSFLGRTSTALLSLASGIIVAQGLGRAFTYLRETLFDFPAKLQQIQIGFEGMFGGSVEKADGLMAALKQFAIPTPFEFADLAPLAQQALAFKLIDKNAKDAAKDTVSLLTDVGDAAFGLGRGQEGVNRIMLALGQMKTATRVMGGEMLQLQQVGINGWDYLSKATGKTTGELRKLVSDGVIPADKAIAAIRAGLKQDFGGSMVRASKTALGALSQIKDTLAVGLSTKFADQFDQISDKLIRLADYVGSADFGQKLDQMGALAQSGLDKIGKAWQFLALTYQNNKGVIDTALLLVGTRLLWINAVAKAGPMGAIMALASVAQLLGQRTDGVGQAARALTPILYAMAAAYTVVKVAAAQAAIAQGLAAGASGNAAALGGLAGGVAKFSSALAFLKTQASIFKFVAASSGPLSALSTVLTGLTASVSALALVALPLLAAAVGVAAIGYQVYQEKAARVDAANAQLSASTGEVEAAFKSLGEITAISPNAGKAVSELADKYKSLGDNLAGLQKFRALDLPNAKSEVAFNTKLKPLERAVLIDEITRVQGEVDDQIAALQFKVEVEAQANPTSLENVKTAFAETYSWLANYLQNYYSTIGGYATASAQFFVRNATWVGNRIKANWQITTGFVAGLWDQMFGSVDDGAGRFLRGLWDKISTFVNNAKGLFSNFAQSAMSWVNGGGGAEAAPLSLPGFGPGFIADQKKKNAEYRQNQRGPVSSGTFAQGLAGSLSVPVAGPMPATATQKAEMRRAELMAQNGPKATTIPQFDPDAGKSKKKAGKSDAEKAADKEAAQQRRVEKDQLTDLAKSYDLKAKAAQDSAKVVAEMAKNQVDALTTLRDSVRDVFGSMQDEFVRLGLIDNPLGPMIRNFEKALDLGGRTAAIVDKARQKFDGFQNQAASANRAANGARSRQERAIGLDGYVPSKVNTSVGNIGSTVGSPQFMQRMFDKVGRSTGVQCGQAISNALGSPGFATRVAKGLAGRTVRPDKNGRLPDGAVVSQSYGTAAQHFFIAYTDAQGVQRKLESTTAGGKGRHYRSDRPITARDLRRITRAALPPGVSGKSGGYDASSSGYGSYSSNGGGATQTELPAIPMFDVAAIDGSLSKIGAVDKAWGRAVDNIEGNSQRFAMQTQLASVEFQSKIVQWAATSKKTVPQIIKQLRDLANTADTLLNRKRAVDAATASIKEMANARAVIGTENNPLVALQREFESGGKFADAPDKRGDVLRAQAGLSLEQVTKATKDATDAETDRIAVLAQARAALTATNAGTDAYDRALEDANRKFEVWRSPDIRGLLEMRDTFLEMAGAAREAAQMMEDSGLFTKKEIHMERARGNAYANVGNKLGASANENATKRITTGQTSAEQAREDKRKQARDEFDYTQQIQNTLDAKERELLLNAALSDSEREIALARAKYISDTKVALRKEGYKPGAAKREATRRADQQNFATPAQNAAISEYNALMLESERAQKAFGDTTGLAGAQWELAKGKLQSLTDAQKANYLVEQAASLGRQKYGQEIDALTSQATNLFADYAQRRQALAGITGPMAQQELQWKIQDAQESQRLLGLTDAQRDAYDAQRPKVLALRDSVRALYQQGEKLAAQEWFKSNDRRMEILRQPLELERRKMELEDQLRSQGFTDQATIDQITSADALYNKMEEAQNKFKDFATQAQSIFQTGFQEAAEKGPMAFFDSVISGTADMIANISRQMLSSALTNTIMKVFGIVMPGIGSSSPSPGGVTGFSGTSVGVPNMLASPRSGGTSYAAIGEKYVQNDGSRYILHRGEGILTARENELYRGSIGRGAPYGGGSSTGGAVTVTNHFTINGAKDPRTVGAEVARHVEQTMSRRAQQQTAYDGITPGGRQR